MVRTVRLNFLLRIGEEPKSLDLFDLNYFPKLNSSFGFLPRSQGLFLSQTSLILSKSLSVFDFLISTLDDLALELLILRFLISSSDCRTMSSKFFRTAAVAISYLLE